MGVFEENLEFYKKEAKLAFSVLRRNRYNTAPPYQWFGPDPEPDHKE